MTSSRYSEITDELLSAYIDNVVTEHERELVEQAAREDDSVAWRLATLRETVQLLRALPMLQAPRSFVLTAEQLGRVDVEPAIGPIPTTTQSSSVRKPVEAPASEPGAWTRILESWRRFWQGGSPVWRNAMAASFAALVVLLLLPSYLTSSMSQRDMLMVSSSEPVLEAMPAAAEDAPSSEAAKALAESPEAAPAAALTEAAAESQAPVIVQESAARLDAPAPDAAMERDATTNTTTVRIIPSEDVREEDVLTFRTEAQPAAGEEDALAGAAAAPMAAPIAAAESAVASITPITPANEVGAAAAAIVVATADQQAQRRVEPETAAQQTSDEAAGAVGSAEQLTIEQPAPAAAEVELSAAEPVPTTAPIAATAVGSTASGGEQSFEDRARVEPSPATTSGLQAVTAAPASSAFQLLPWLQLAAALAAIGFALLWWYSRRHPQTES